MQEPFETQNSQPESQPASLQDGAEFALHMADPRLRPYEQVAGAGLLNHVEQQRELEAHEKIDQIGQKIDQFRQWEQVDDAQRV